MQKLLIFAAYAAAVVGQCPEGNWTLLSDGQRCIKAFPTALVYTDAQTFCRKHFGFLGSIRNDLDTWFYYEAIKHLPSARHFWIGLYRPPTSSTYIWDDGTVLKHTNWKPGTKTSVSLSDCATFEADSAKWEAGNECESVNLFICEAITTESCPQEELEVSTSYVQVMQTEGISNGRTVSGYDCTKEIAVARGCYENVYVNIKVYAGKNAFIRFVDVVTGNEIRRFANNEEWQDTEFYSNSSRIRVEAFAERNGKLGYTIHFSTRAAYCPYTIYNTTVDVIPYVRSDHYNRTLTDYYCSKAIVAPAGFNILLNVTAYVGTNAVIEIFDDVRSILVARFQDQNQWFTKEINTYAEKAQFVARSGSQGGVAFLFGYSAVPTKCETKTYNARKDDQAVASYEYPKLLSPYTCTTEIVLDAKFVPGLHLSVNTTFSGDGKLVLTSIDTAEVVHEFSSASGNLVSIVRTLYLEASGIRLYAYASREGSIAFTTSFKLPS